MAGSVAPINNVGGSKQMPAMMHRSNMPKNPAPAHAVYTPLISGIPNRSSRPMAPIPNSMKAYTRKGWNFRDTNRENKKLPTHIPPINVPSNMPSETVETPITSPSNWT